MKGTPEDPYSQGRDAVNRPWENQYHYAFPSFSMISKVLNKVKQDQVEKCFFLTPTWQSQTFYLILLNISIEKPALLLEHQHLLINPQKHLHPLFKTKVLRLAVRIVSRKSYLREVFQRPPPNLFQVHYNQAPLQITIRPCHSGLAGVVKIKLIQVLTHLSFLFDPGLPQYIDQPWALAMHHLDLRYMIKGDVKYIL